MRTGKLEDGKTVRFKVVVGAAGKPQVYLPLFDPNKDHAFMRAVEENRVLSIRQEPTARRKDFGVVGFDEQQTKAVAFGIAAFVPARSEGPGSTAVGAVGQQANAISIRVAAAPFSDAVASHHASYEQNERQQECRFHKFVSDCESVAVR
jgi:hypothetical protein